MKSKAFLSSHNRGRPVAYKWRKGLAFEAKG